MIRGLIITAKRVIAGDMTVKQAFFYAKMRLFNTQRDLNDDFDWTQYHLHYREELKIVGRTATLLPNPGDFSFSLGELRQVNKDIKPLHPNHHLLYETILRINPQSVLEIGSGGGDHLRNLHLLSPTLALFGVDRSEQQMQTLSERHPRLPARLEIHDITNPETILPQVDVVFSQTVLMHISESQDRLLKALNNILRAARSQVVMVEDWSEHDFLSHLKRAIRGNPEWAQAKIYFAFRASHSNVRVLILSKTSLPYQELIEYNDLLQGRKLQIH